MKEEKLGLDEAIRMIAKLCIKENKNSYGETKALELLITALVKKDCTKLTEVELCKLIKGKL